ncbi:MAG TPA: caspase family protein [Oscillatoriales cyanobacterium M4454_W2019_049]|nr:caspase family protein [Oscillatoriales cyanobacterium M4454_W2019_049]
MKRRHFLQFAGSTLAALGINQFDLFRQGDRYGRVLAQDTPRKLALLVGINDYTGAWPSLKGCLTDVEMQRQLLIHGFGFNESDIRVVTNASRNEILTAFEEHLIKQAKPGDVAVFHFSGHGSRVIDLACNSIGGFNSTFVPIDSPIPANDEGTVNDIMGRSLFLLMSAVQTENLTVILDSCHSGGGKRGNFTVRSRPGSEIFAPSETELEFQERIRLDYTNLSPEEVEELRCENIAKGVVIASASRDQLAVDAPFDDFHAGAFTYLMTRYLWQQTRSEPISQVLAQLARTTEVMATKSGILQIPEMEFNPPENQSQPLYFIEPEKIPAEGVILQVQGDTVDIWLGGVDPESLEAFTADTLMSVMDASRQDIGGDSPLLIKLESRNGLLGQGKIQSHPQQSTIRAGMFVQEQVRVIDEDISLHIGLDSESLNASELAEAKQLLEAFPRIKTHPLGQQEVQYIFGREIERNLPPQPESDLPPRPTLGSVGLFLPALEIVRDSFGSANESITAAVERLQAKFTALSIARVLKILQNPDSTRMDIAASLQLAQPLPGTVPIQGSVAPVRGGGGNPGQPTRSRAVPDLPELKVGTDVQFEVTNNEADDLYFSVLLIGADGEVALIFPVDWVAPIESSRVAAGESRNIPEDTDSFGLRIGSTLGVSEALVLASRQPLRDFLKIIQDLAATRGVSRGFVGADAEESANAVASLLGDLRGNTRGALDIYAREGRNTIDSAQIAAVSIAFRVIPAA